MDDDIKNLYGTGHFLNIRILEEPTPDGVILTYILVVRPRVTDIKFTGNTKWDAGLRLLKAGLKSFAEKLSVESLLARLPEIYQRFRTMGSQMNFFQESALFTRLDHAHGQVVECLRVPTHGIIQSCAVSNLLTNVLNHGFQVVVRCLILKQL